MRLKKETHTEEYYVYNCPLCGEEVRWYEGRNEQTPCADCYYKLHTLERYEENKFLLGAVISAIRVGRDELDSFTITTRNGRKFRVYSHTDYEGSSELRVVETHEENS